MNSEATHEQAVRSFLSFGLPVVRDPSTWLDFEQLARLISQPSLITSVAAILNQILTKKAKRPLQRARMFLSAYVIYTCQNAILQDTQEDLAKQIHTASKQLLDGFESFVTNPAEYSEDITPLWKYYVRLFEEWKVKDQQKLLESTVAHYHSLLHLKSSISQSCVHENSLDRRDTLQLLDEQLKDVQEKIESIGGAVPKEMRPHHEIPTPPETDYDDEKKLDEERQQTALQCVQRLLMTEQVYHQKLTNEQLAHELVVDPEFRLARPPEESLERRIATAASKAFFNQLVRDMDKSNLLEVLSDLRKKLDQIVPLSEKRWVADVIDLDVIRRQLDTNSFDLDAIIDFALDRMAISCAPARDAAIRNIQYSSHSTADRLWGVMDVLQDMLLDLANIQLASLRPHLLPIAVQYGREQFQKNHQRNSRNLVHTRAWLAAGHESAAIHGNPRTRFNNAFASLVTTGCTDEVAIPEIFVLDTARIHHFQKRCIAITTVAALVMLAKSFGMQGKEDALITRLQLLVQNDTTTVDHLCAELERCCTLVPANTTTEGSKLIRVMVDKTLNRQDALFSLLQRRLASIISHYLNHQRSMPARETLESYGLDFFANDLESFCERAAALADYNYHVHGETIQTLLA
ncbi:T-complex protein 11-domain-containing protein [Dichotomocladium elegans]|nr:T-complex protein 11-domain-containing protein [Dichotomocladium elegans]